MASRLRWQHQSNRQKRKNLWKMYHVSIVRVTFPSQFSRFLCWNEPSMRVHHITEDWAPNESLRNSIDRSVTKQIVNISRRFVLSYGYSGPRTSNHWPFIYNLWRMSANQYYSRIIRFVFHLSSSFSCIKFHRSLSPSHKHKFQLLRALFFQESNRLPPCKSKIEYLLDGI